MHSLDIVLQTALSSKRFTCSHLLALRFDEEEDDFYWEDVRSVMALLSTSLEDETSRLSEAMDEWHQSRLRDSRPSVTSTPSRKELPMPASFLPQRKHREPISFAPQLSNAAKMVAHVKSIASALDQAYDNLESCASLVQQFDENSDVDIAAMSTMEASAQSVMTAYEALRRELGLALRECERARSPLLSILTSHSRDSTAQDESTSDLELSGDHDDSTVADDSFPLDSPSRAGAGSPPPAYVSRGPSQIVDDVTAHLLAGATANNLPPPGAERVFEADSETTVGVYNKKRSSLSREERIALAQAKRRIARSLVSGDGSLDHEDRFRQPNTMGSDVMEELKQVISLVNARKQHMATLPSRKDQPTGMDRFSPSNYEAPLSSRI
jgi:hypothetical protein